MLDGGEAVRTALAGADIMADLVDCVKIRGQPEEETLFEDACSALHALTFSPSARAQVRCRGPGSAGQNTAALRWNWRGRVPAHLN